MRACLAGLTLIALLLLCGQPLLRAAAVNIHQAATDNDLQSVQELLTAEPALLNSPDAEGRTVLIIAAAWGYDAMVTYLLGKGADVNRVDKDGRSALHWAAGTGRVNIARMLLQRKVNTKLVDRAGMTAKQIAQKQNHPEIVTAIDEAEKTATPPPALGKHYEMTEKEAAVLKLLGTARFLTLGWGTTELSSASLAAGRTETLEAERQLLNTRGLSAVLLDMTMQKAKVGGIQYLVTGVSQQPTLAEVRAILGNPQGDEQDTVLDPTQRAKGEQPVTWHRFEWLQFGVVGDRVQFLRADCRQADVTVQARLPKPGQIKINPKDGAEMVYVPEGEFPMGNDKMGDGDERPVHKVTLDGYWMYRREVTAAQYKKFCDATNRQMMRQPPWTSDAHPVVYVTWEDAVAYAEWVGGRLPTEAEWEKAARGTDGRRYPWGEAFDAAKCNSAERKQENALPVGSYPAGASPYNALDMSGNVYEWCQDWYMVMYYWNSPKTNPQGPATAPAADDNYKINPSRAIRGGSWKVAGNKIYPANRKPANPSERAIDRGFRVVLPESAVK